jgi:hypothetical protein
MLRMNKQKEIWVFICVLLVSLSHFVVVYVRLLCSSDVLSRFQWWETTALSLYITTVGWRDFHMKYPLDNY